MRRALVAAPIGALVATALVVACASDPTIAPGVAALPDAGLARAPEAGVVALDAAADVAEDPGPALPLGTFAVVEVAESPCAPRGGTSTLIWPGPAPGALTRMRSAGARRVAGDADGFVTFDPAGTSAQTEKESVGAFDNAFAVSGGVITAVGASPDRIEAHRFNPMGSPTNTSVVVASGTQAVQGLAVAAATNSAFVVWADGRLYGAGIDAAGTGASPAFPIGAPFQSMLGDALAPGRTEGEVAVVWTAAVSGGFETWFALVTGVGIASAPVRVLSSTATHRVVRLAKGTSGYLLAVDGDAASYLVPLGTTGVAAGPARHFAGVSFTWDLAVHGTAFGVLAATPDGRSRFRPVDATGTPTGGWICLGDAAVDQAALDDDPTGFAALVRAQSDHRTELLRFDVTGQGPDAGP